MKYLWSLSRYGELYRPKVRGEASTNYAIIDEYLLNELVILNPDIKAILLIRNPVDRAWSNAKLNYFNDHKNLSEISESELFGFFHGSKQIKCGRFSNIINKWSKYLKDGNLFVGFFDDIVGDPEELLLRIYRFLGVRSEKKYIPPTVRDRINQLQFHDLPEKHENYLKTLFQDELEFLRKTYGLSWYD